MPHESRIVNSRLPDMTGIRKAASVGGKAYAYGANQAKRPLGSLKKGGKIKKTGLYKLHKGEKVVPTKKGRKKSKKGKKYAKR